MKPSAVTPSRALGLLLVLSSWWLASSTAWAQGGPLETARAALPPLEGDLMEPYAGDWLIERVDRPAGVHRGAHMGEVVLDNGLVRQTLRVAPNAALVG